MTNWTAGGRKSNWIPYKKSWKLSNPKWKPSMAYMDIQDAFPTTLRTKLHYRETFDIGTTSSGANPGGRNLYLTNIYDPMTGTGNQSAYMYAVYQNMYEYYHVIGVKYKIHGQVYSGSVVSNIGTPTNVVTLGKIILVPLTSGSSGFSNANDAINWPLARFRNYSTNQGTPAKFEMDGYLSIAQIHGRQYDPSLDNSPVNSIVGPSENYIMTLGIYQEGTASASDSYMHVTVECDYYVEWNLRRDTNNNPADVPGDS